jgi:hypothetical protein
MFGRNIAAGQWNRGAMSRKHYRQWCDGIYYCWLYFVCDVLFAMYNDEAFRNGALTLSVGSAHTSRS